MEIVIGVSRSSASKDAVALGLAIAKTVGAKPVLVTIYNRSFDFPGPAKVDAEWQQFLIDQAEETIARTRDDLNGTSDLEVEVAGNRSSGKGLAETAQERGASMIVIGSNHSASEGRIGIGSTADSLLHSSPVPVALAPLGYHDWAPESIGHAVVAYRKTRESDHALQIVIEAFKRRPINENVGINLVTLIERTTRIYGSRLGSSAENPVMNALREQAQLALAKAVATIPDSVRETTTELLIGDNIGSALAKFDWHDDDIFVAGSSGGGPLKRVFLGDTTYKLIRNSQLPVVIIPASAEV